MNWRHLLPMLVLVALLSIYGLAPAPLSGQTPDATTTVLSSGTISPTLAATLTVSPAGTPGAQATVTMTGTPSAIAAGTPASETTVVRTDDFAGSCGLSQVDDEGRTYRCENGEYLMMLKRPQVSGWVWYNGQVDDVIAEADGRVVEGESADYGLIFRRTSSGSYYFFSVMQGKFYLGLYHEKKWKQLMGWTASSAIQGGTVKNRLKVVAQGSEIGLYINDQFLATCSDSTLAGGNVGLFLANEQPSDKVAFSNVRVSTINRPLIPPAATPAFTCPPRIPDGMGGVAVLNFFGQEVNYTIDGKMYTVPPNGRVFIHLPPGSYPASFTMAGRKLACTTPTCVMQVREGQYATMTLGD